VAEATVAVVAVAGAVVSDRPVIGGAEPGWRGQCECQPRPSPRAAGLGYAVRVASAAGGGTTDVFVDLWRPVSPERHILYGKGIVSQRLFWNDPSVFMEYMARRMATGCESGGTFTR